VAIIYLLWDGATLYYLEVFPKIIRSPISYISIQHPLDWEHSGVSTQDGGWEIHVTDGKKENHRKHSQPKVVF
jgi:hypothetical protein